jgi:hypothetical protein
MEDGKIIWLVGKDTVVGALKIGRPRGREKEEGKSNGSGGAQAAAGAIEFMHVPGCVKRHL